MEPLLDPPDQCEDCYKLWCELRDTKAAVARVEKALRGILCTYEQTVIAVKLALYELDRQDIIKEKSHECQKSDPTEFA